MKFVREFLQNALIGGVLVVLPIYLALVVLLKGVQSVVPLVRPFTMLLQAWLPAENLLSLILSRTAASPSSSHRFPRLLPEPSISSGRVGTSVHRTMAIGGASLHERHTMA
jgi:hypothetical protein